MPRRSPQTRPVPPRVSSPRQVMRDSFVLLGSVRATLAELLRAVQAGEEGALRRLGGKQAELESALKRAFDAEGRYNDWLERRERGEGRDGGGHGGGQGDRPWGGHEGGHWGESRGGRRGGHGGRGEAAPVEIDFEALRHELAERLNKLRECAEEDARDAGQG